MSTFQKAKVVMLPTNEKATDNPFSVGVTLCNDGKLRIGNPLEKSESRQHFYILSSDRIKEGDYCYVKVGVDISGKELFEVALCTKIGVSGIHYFDELGLCWGKHTLNAKKIIASTDSSLNLPQPSQAFIRKYMEEYNKGQQIIDILVEYEEVNDFGEPYSFDDMDFGVEKEYKLKVNPKDNTITIKKIKSSFTLKEMKEIAIMAYNEGFYQGSLKDSPCKDGLPWIEKALQDICTHIE